MTSMTSLAAGQLRVSCPADPSYGSLNKTVMIRKISFAMQLKHLDVNFWFIFSFSFKLKFGLFRCLLNV